MCFHCPRCSLDRPNLGFTENEYRTAGIVPCQNKFGKNARRMGGTFGLAESLAAATENQASDVPHIHGIMAVVTPYQYSTLSEIRDLITRDITQLDAIKRYVAHTCREDHFDDAKHQAQLTSLEKAKADGLHGVPHCRLSLKPAFFCPRGAAAESPSLWDLDEDSNQNVKMAKYKKVKILKMPTC